MKKSALGVAVLVVLLIVGGMAFWNYRNTILNQQPAENNQTPPAALSFKDQKISDNTKPFKIDVTYPSVDGMDDFNALVKSKIDADLAQFKNDALENDAAFKQTDPASYAQYPREYDYLATYTKGQLDENIASVILNIEDYTGGAHGAHYFIPVNYNLKTKKEITLGDVFAGQPNYLKTISDYSIKDLTAQITKAMGDTQGTWIADGAGPVASNYQIFLINGNNITFYFGEYQVAPYVAGDFEVTMSLPTKTN